MRKNAEAVAKRLADVYGVDASVVEVDGTFYVVVEGAEDKVIPSMIGGIWIRRAPWP
jgi:hypothetical protein